MTPRAPYTAAPVHGGVRVWVLKGALALETLGDRWGQLRGVAFWLLDRRHAIEMKEHLTQVRGPRPRL